MLLFFPIPLVPVPVPKKWKKSLEPPLDMGHSMCERNYSPWQCLKACNTMPFHIPWHTSIGYAIYHTMSASPYHILCDVRQAIPWYMVWTDGHRTVYGMACRGMSWLYHIPCQPTKPYHNTMRSRQAILYTIRGPPGHTIHHEMPARPYHIP